MYLSVDDKIFFFHDLGPSYGMVLIYQHAMVCMFIGLMIQLPPFLLEFT